jgi:hypothetical protein
VRPNRIEHIALDAAARDLVGAAEGSDTIGD